MSDSSTGYVLRLDVVRWAIQRLLARRIHPYFIAYLHIRATSVHEGLRTSLRPEWNNLKPFLEVPGGPPGCPYYRPTWHRSTVDRSAYWLNPNLAGSFAPSSVRGVPRQVLDVESGGFDLKSGDAHLALTSFLYDQPVSIQAWSYFLYRRHAFYSRSVESPKDDPAVEAFKEDWGFKESDDLTVLFVSDSETPEDPYTLHPASHE